LGPIPFILGQKSHPRRMHMSINSFRDILRPKNKMIYRYMSLGIFLVPNWYFEKLSFHLPRFWQSSCAISSNTIFILKKFQIIFMHHVDNQTVTSTLQGKANMYLKFLKIQRHKGTTNLKNELLLINR
jgi:hypothetical protein